MNLPPNEMDLSRSQPHGHIPGMDHAIDKWEMKHPASSHLLGLRENESDLELSGVGTGLHSFLAERWRVWEG